MLHHYSHTFWNVYKSNSHLAITLSSSFEMNNFVKNDNFFDKKNDN